MLTHLRNTTLVLLFVFFSVLLCNPNDSRAQPTKYPNKLVKIIAPASPGGAMDSLAREIAKAYTNQFSKTFVVENHPGAGGNIGLAIVAKAPNDGYTLGIGAANSLVTNRFLYASMPFDTSKDLQAVAFIGRVPFILVVNSSVPADNLNDLIALMKAKNSNFNFGSSGVGNTSHLFGELFKMKTGVTMEHIPFKSSGDAVQEVIAGRVQVQFGTPVELLSHINRGTIKPIAIAGAKRLPNLPNIPTLSELGIAGFESPTWFGVVAPANTPTAIVLALNEATQKALASPEVKNRLDQNSVQTQTMSPEEFQKFIYSEAAKWGAIVKASGAQIN
jgi:tripartite-type tricarboxylate transporter receptor subunit TctC